MSKFDKIGIEIYEKHQSYFLLGFQIAEKSIFCNIVTFFAISATDIENK
jgi:hypothetical protein